MLAVHRLGWAVGVRRGGHQLVPPVVATGLHGHVLARAAVHDHVLDRWALAGRHVRLLLQVHDLAASVAPVGGDQDLGLAVPDALGQRLTAEAAEDDHVGGADTGTG